MTLTQNTTITWPSNEDQFLPAIESARITLVEQMVADGKTDGTVVIVSPTVSTRPWIDTDSAQEYIDSITSIATTNGVTIVSAVITPI